MEQAQRVKMYEQIRSERGAGRPEVAQQIQKALDRDEYFLGDVNVEPFVVVDVPKKTATKSKWQEFAKKNSDFDHELIEGITRKDLLSMLLAHGIIDKFDK